MPFKIPKKIWLEHLGEEMIKTVRLSTIVIGITLVVFFMLEQLKSGLISNTVNINGLVAVELTLMVVLLFFGQRFKKRLPKKRWLFLGLLICLTVCFIVIVLAGANNLISILMAMLATVIAYIVWYSYVYES